ncbi:MAG TPA: helix-turn-helix domain-containing protein [Acidimicrobiales bacterium]|nr:helix-turn-helix domain-containing protein [Acidimicrobiales bacterium]
MGRRRAETLTVEQAAAALGMSVRTVGRLVARGDLPALDVDGERFVERAELDDWIERHRMPAPVLRGADPPTARLLAKLEQSPPA